MTPTACPHPWRSATLNLNDETVEGLTHRDYPIVSIQYHSEASPGPLDNVYLFQRFLDMVKDQKS